ncbi:hypothetical protein [Aquibacillus kalidii]|uniref:hypothetical protein n=1 Tax=Aquibacillus kalidii TaxID=2762597 RepID=UPI0016470E83|nr:hypothetical protein [Aquibacillus kalidii]
MRVFLALITSLVLLVGCNVSADTTFKDGPVKIETKVVQKEEPVQVTESEPSKEIIDDQFIIDNIKLGMTQDEIVELIGEPDAVGVDIMEGNPMWRYDIGADENYIFEEPEELKGSGVVDTIDEAGLKKGLIDSQLFISWQEEKIQNFANHVYKSTFGEYRVFKDGTVKKTY